MAHFAKVNQGKVIEVMVADSDFLTNFREKTPGTWIETFKDGSQRGCFAGIGYTYDHVEDKFYSPKPYNSWTWNETDGMWEAPTSRPVDADDDYIWNEETQSWDAVESE